MCSQEVSQQKKQKVHRYMEKGRLTDAITLVQKIIKQNPYDPEALYMLGCSFARLCRWDEAIRALTDSIKILPNVPQSHFALAGAYIATGQEEIALASLERTLEINPGMAEAHVAIANILISREETISAKDHLDIAIDLNPKCSDAYLGLASLEQIIGMHRTAVPYLEKSLEYDPKNIKAICSMATALANLTQKDMAATYFKKALNIEPHNIDAVSGMAMIHNFNGEYEAAYNLINPLLKKKIFHSSLGVAFAQCCHKVGFCKEAVSYIDEVLKRGGMSKASEKSIHFAAAKVLDRMHEYDKAFSHYKFANDAIRYLYDSVAHAQRNTVIMSDFTPELFMRAPRAENTDTRPVFIVGMPRSGTSLTEQILASHSNVYAAGELSDLSDIILQMAVATGERNNYLHCVEKLSQQQINSAAQKYLDKLTSLSTAANRITDKMPHNYYLLGFIQLLFPGARIIHCRRDPVDTCLSIYFQDFNEYHKYAKSLFDIGTHYHQYMKLMQHWQNVLTLPILDLDYEELVSDQENVTRRLLEFCELEWEEGCLQFYKYDRTVDTASFDQVRQPLYKKSVERWRNYDKYLDELREGLLRPH
jgi:tetratricopeptide (TPR) repeat protein